MKIKEKLRKSPLRAVGTGLSIFACGLRAAGRWYAWVALVLLLIGLWLLLFSFGGRTWKTVLVIILAVMLALFTALEIPVVRASRGDRDNDADYLIVLGAGVRGTVPSLSLSDRLEAALRYLNEHPKATAIVSGGQGKGEDITEAQCMAEWLMEHGIPEERILREERAVNTEENLRFSVLLAGERAENARFAVVSSGYHLYRTKMLARLAGLEVKTVSAPSSRPIMQLNYYIREAAGVLFYTVFS